MANEVNITITGSNVSGPAFASAMGDLAKLRLEAAALAKEMDKIGKLRIDPNEATSSLIALRSKMQSLGIADIADVNVNPGRITTQLQMLKRLIDQAGISDILDVNVDKPAIASQLRDLAGISETIPIRFNIGAIPDLPKLGESIPLKFNIGSIPNLPQLGAIENVSSLNAAREAFQSLGLTISDVNTRLGIVDGSFARTGAMLLDSQNAFQGLGLSMDNTRSAMAILSGQMLPVMAQRMQDMNAVTRVALPLFQNAGGGWAFMSSRISLFGHALDAVLPPFLASISLWHLSIELAIEFGASLLGAAVALGTFAAAAVPTFKDIYSILQSTYTVNQAFGASIYPLTGGFQQMAQAVQPEVYVLFGEALYVVNQKTGAFTTLATAAGKVVDDLGARFTYAVTQGKGMNAFLAEAPKDLQGWGNVIGNIGGIIGNVFKVLPGYAAIILHALDDVTHAIELVTGSALGEWLLKIGLVSHGALVYVGLLATAFTFLATRALSALPGLFLGIATGLDRIGVSGAASTMLNTAAAVEKLAVSTAAVAGIGLLAAGFGYLVFEALTAKSAVDDFFANLQQQAQGASILNLQSTLTTQLAIAQKDYAAATQQVTLAQQHYNQVSANQPLYLRQAAMGLQIAKNNAGDYAAGLQQIKDEQSIVNQHVQEAAGIFHGTANAWSALNAAGITSSQLLDTNRQHWEEAMIEAQAYDNTLRAVTQTTGRYGAAQNALNFVAGDSANALGQVDSAMTKVVQAQDQLINVVLGGQQSFLSYMSSLDTMNTDFGKAKFGIDGLSLSSRTLANDFYTTAIPAAQKLIDSLDMQNISTKDLTTVIATQAGELLKYAGNSDTARATVVALINNALGPGTVSLQSLNKWVGTNSTTLNGFKSIVDKTTISAGSLAGVLQNDLNAQFAQDILKSSGATKDMQNFTNALVNGGSNTSRFHGARQQLITDLENAGFSAHDATGFVDGLQRKIDAMHGKTVGVGVHASGSGQITARENILGETQQVIGNLLFVNKGGRIPGFGDVDSVMAMLTPGEAVIPKWLVPILSPLLRKYGVPGFVSGGYVQDPQSIADFEGSMGSRFIHQPWPVYGKAESSKFLNDLNAAAQKMAQAAAAAAGGGAGTPGPGGGDPTSNQMLAMRLAPYWANGMEWADWRALWNQESGWNQYARNPGSGAYGIPQALPPGKMGAAANPPQSNPAAQISWGIGYIKGRYGDPIGAWAHEVAFNWYDNGGWLMPGMNIAMNGTGRPERVSPPNGGFDVVRMEIQAGGASAFEAFMVEAIRHWVRIKGGGDVQKAFGRR